VYRAEGIGSLLRPPYLEEARGAIEQGRLTAAEFKRIEDAARFFPREQLGLSTQCGFASAAEGNPITESAQEDKLRLIAGVAHTTGNGG
jgi:methionine synthase II (cobalamin-independent)